MSQRGTKEPGAASVGGTRRSLDAMIAEAFRQGWMTSPRVNLIPELIDPFARVSSYGARLVDAADPDQRESLALSVSRCLFAKAVEGTILWGFSSDGNISVYVDKRHLLGDFETDVPAELRSTVIDTMPIGESLWRAHQRAVAEAHRAGGHVDTRAELAQTLEWIPRFGVIYAMSRNLHLLPRPKHAVMTDGSESPTMALIPDASGFPSFETVYTAAPRLGTYSVVEDASGFLVMDAGRPAFSPGGNQLRTVSRDLAEEVAQNLRQHGPNPAAMISMYSCLCSCLDYGQRAGTREIHLNSLTALDEDPVLRQPSTAEYAVHTWANSFVSYFVHAGIRTMGADQARRWALAEAADWSMQEIMVVQLVAANVGSPLLGMALAQDAVNPWDAALSFCSSALSKIVGAEEDTVPGFYPQAANEDFCNSQCLPTISGDDEREVSPGFPDRFRRECGVALSLDVWRRFAAYGREQRLAGKNAAV